MYYRHNLDYQYPEQSDQHMIEVKRIREINFDETYEYLPKGKKEKRTRRWFVFIAHVLVFPLCAIRHGVRIHGRKKLKNYKDLLKDGAITVSNHVFMWDYLCVLMAIRPQMEYHMVWKTNLEGSNGYFIRSVGGIPVPTDNIKGMVKFQQAISEVLKRGDWLHVFPEGAMWYYYPDIRPLKKAVFKYAVRYNKPVLPITMSFRPRKGIARLFTKNPAVDVNVGDPILPDTNLPMTEAIDKIHAETYHVMQVMNGVNPGDPTYNTNQKISEYKKTM